MQHRKGPHPRIMHSLVITLIPLGFRASLVVMVSIPLSLTMGVFALAQLGFTLNQISISGFIISLGLLVDDSIVVTENIERHMRQGESPIDAAISGTKEISLAVLGSTGVLLFAFLPLAFLPEGSGDFVRGLPVAVLVTIASSLIVSLTIIPFIASRLLKTNAHPDGNAVLRAMNRSIQRFYQPILHWGLAHPRKTVWGSMAICFAALGTLPFIGTSLFPASDSPYFMVRVETPEGSGMVATDRAVRDVSKILGSFPGVTGRMENVGRGNPQIFYNNIPREDDTRYGEIFVTIDKWSPADSPGQLDELRRKFDAYPAAKVTVVQFENGPPVEAPVAIRLQGSEIEGLRKAAAARNTSGLSGVILFALFGIFAVLVAEFGGFREVAVVAGVIPLGLFGGILALILTGNSVSFLAIIGFVALIGIEIKNSILLVDFTTRLREESMELIDAIERAGEIRFLPVLLTSVTAIGGLLPLALSGSPLYAPLAWVIIGGLISSTLLSRIVTPVMYLLIVRGGVTAEKRPQK